jgi:hypothetical protein
MAVSTLISFGIRKMSRTDDLVSLVSPPGVHGWVARRKEFVIFTADGTGEVLGAGEARVS